MDEGAIDDLGEGVSSLRLWSELKPAFIKIDKHFIADVHQDPHKIQFVRSIRQMAAFCSGRAPRPGNLPGQAATGC